MVKIKRIVIDSLKPHETEKLDLSRALCSIKGVEEVKLSVTEVDEMTETIRIIINGDDVDFEGVHTVFNDFGTAIRSIDEIDVKKK